VFTIGTKPLMNEITKLARYTWSGANQLVKSNCEGPDRHVVESTDPGPYAPDLPALKTIGAMSHCEPGAPAVPAGTGGSSGGTYGGSSSLYSGSGSSTGSTTEATGETGASGGVTALARKHGATVALAASKLPLPLPDTGSGLNRFVVLLVGAGGYLLLRRPVRRLLVRGGSP
jgi:hypothetical protein